MDAGHPRVQGGGDASPLPKGTEMKAYRFFAYLIAVEVVLQASFIAFGVFGETKWIEDDGGVLNKAVLDADKHPTFTGAIGYGLHFLNGMMLIPLIAVIFLIVAFFAKVPSGAKWAAIVLLLVVVQVAMGLSGIVWLGPLHGINAFILFGTAVMAGKRATAAPASVPAAV